MKVNKVAIMQPYFLPYLGYISLIRNVDLFILFDTPQFIRHGWIERNNILNAKGLPIYIKVPLKKHSQKTVIGDVIINNTLPWKDKIFAQLECYKKFAPNYREVIGLLESIFRIETESITNLNYLALISICNYLEIRTPIKIWSEMNVEIDEVNAPDEWALNICRKLNIKEYYNPIGGKGFFDINKYNNENVKLKFIDLIPKPYKQFGHDFVPFLSIVDVMMFCNKREINSMLNNINFIK